ncbi:pyridoxal phosphate homeostasis protein [Ischnura elegans]|uniref:pyridoxal phosphate homeostasis protein n=1 Tax=Ischnura elegans TaxID=197161 RepID=UPI001ED8B011|nr:pyridoxal phosphate homeostasis protein [Ischnura elegans]
MIRRAMSEAEVAKCLRSVFERIQNACTNRPQELSNFEPRLVAVSKTKPKELIIAAYDAGQRSFGENYVQELVEKANDPEILEKCQEIRWHFIGHLQRNKVNKIVDIPGLFVVETVDSAKLASAINDQFEKRGHRGLLNVMVQVNTSGEEEKSGCPPDEAPVLAKHILEKCKNLNFLGLMTIGVYGYDLSLGPNPDFQCLRNCREKVCQELGLTSSQVELSMGMSNDFEQAIEMGSSNVRVGSLIFGDRTPKVTQQEEEQLTQAVGDVKLDNN